MGSIGVQEEHPAFVEHNGSLVAVYGTDGSTEAIDAARGIVDTVHEATEVPMLVIVDVRTARVYVLERSRLAANGQEA